MNRDEYERKIYYHVDQVDAEVFIAHDAERREYVAKVKGLVDVIPHLISAIRFASDFFRTENPIWDKINEAEKQLSALKGEKT
ncbi:MAG: hypothetical protein GY841_00680 [FCB group bacterium]|nr:hypothetical protein [FCB group bacterium]